MARGIAASSGADSRHCGTSLHGSPCEASVVGTVLDTCCCTDVDALDAISRTPPTRATAPRPTRLQPRVRALESDGGGALGSDPPADARGARATTKAPAIDAVAPIGMRTMPKTNE